MVEIRDMFTELKQLYMRMEKLLITHINLMENSQKNVQEMQIKLITGLLVQ